MVRHLVWRFYLGLLVFIFACGQRGASSDEQRDKEVVEVEDSVPVAINTPPTKQSASNETKETAPSEPLGPQVTRLNLRTIWHQSERFVAGALDIQGKGFRNYAPASWTLNEGDQSGSYWRVGRRSTMTLPALAESLACRIRWKNRGVKSPTINGESFTVGKAWQENNFSLKRGADDNFFRVQLDGRGRVDVAALRCGSNAAAPEMVARGETSKLTSDEKRVFYLEACRGCSLSFESDAPVEVRVDADKGKMQRIDSKHGRISLDNYAGRPVRISIASAAPASVSRLDIHQDQPALRALAAVKNVIVVLVDTLRASKLKLYNSTSRVQTPALDEFASRSFVFLQAQSSENWTKPAIASILSSLRPDQHRAQKTSSKLSEDVLLLPEYLQQRSFRTGAFIANGYISDAFGFQQGWDDYRNYIREQRRSDASAVYRDASRWLKKHHRKPFFLYIHAIDPHVPYDPPDKYRDLYDPRKDYDGPIRNRRSHLQLEDAKAGKLELSESDMVRLEALHDGEISDHDAHFGRFLALVESLGRSEDTLIVMTSDHGEEFREHGSLGHGHSLYQELIHVPLLIHLPKQMTRHNIDSVVSTRAIAPTILDTLQMKKPPSFQQEGLVSYLRGGHTSKMPIAYTHFQRKASAIAGAGYKLISWREKDDEFYELAGPETTQAKAPIARRYLDLVAHQLRHHFAETPNSPAEEKDIDEELCKQLKALGYMECEQK